MSPVRVPAQTRPEQAPAGHIHPPKVETFDLAARTNTDPKGYVRAVDEYRVEPFGLYVAREIVDHPRLAYLESWLLPEQGVRVTKWRHHPGHQPDYDFYLDIADVTPGESAWTTVDHYLDIVLRTGRGATVLDSDELLAAVLAGLLTESVAERALETTYRVIDGLAHAAYDLDQWLAGEGIELRWQER